MDNKIFLDKYRASREEIDPVGEFAGSPLAYKAQQIDSGKNVMVELIPAGSLKMAVRERLEAEAAAAMKLNHVNIPALYDFGVEDGHLVYVTEDFKGIPAEEWVKTHGPLSVGPVLRLASQVVSALDAAAFHQIVHQAINPANIVLVPGQAAEGDWPLVKVLHFVGVAPKLSDTDGTVAAFDTSLHYTSPEQIQRGRVDFRSEIYSLGCTMWFLLTGVPPLVAPKGPIAVAPATAGGKVSAMPKKVRRLLAQMLSTNPEARPRDPLEFSRKLQNCLVQVERREAMSRRFGMPPFSRGPAGLPGSRRMPIKTLALAALFLMIATLAALVMPGYLRHRRIVRAGEPIGVLIGVPGTVSSETPAPADAANAIGSNPTQTRRAVAQSNNPPSLPAGSAEPNRTNALPRATDPAVSAGNNQVAMARPQPPSADSLPNSQAQKPAVAAKSITTGSSEAASVRRAEASPPPAQSPDTVAQRTAREKFAMHEVRRAEPAEPDVRRAEPAPPEEGPDADAPETTASSKPQTDFPAQIAESRDVETETGENTSRSDSGPKVAARPRARSERPAKPKRWMDQRSYPPQPMPELAGALPRLPRRSVRARFLGVTPDGRWMLALPSNKIVIVPPPFP